MFIQYIVQILHSDLTTNVFVSGSRTIKRWNHDLHSTGRYINIALTLVFSQARALCYSPVSYLRYQLFQSSVHVKYAKDFLRESNYK